MYWENVAVKNVAMFSQYGPTIWLVNNLFIFAFVYIFTFSKGFSLFPGDFNMQSPYSEIPDRSSANQNASIHNILKLVYLPPSQFSFSEKRALPSQTVATIPCLIECWVLPGSQMSPAADVMCVFSFCDFFSFL